ncbi:MAG: Holliday junction resolvase RuvX [Chthoniobacterales bacterium]|nr:Holliday junction resolvase RuvX [Chthoniobacterales bacterium]
MKRIMGIDYGRARIGVALSDELQMLAHPTETIAVAKVADPVGRIAALVAEKNVELIVVGLPRHMNGSVGASAEEASGFAEKLRTEIACPVRTWDERLSTVAAQRALREAGKSVRESRGYIDQVAAQMLLQSYLDSLVSNQGGLGPSPFA